MQTKLKSLIAQGEGINIEFKESKIKINRNEGYLFFDVRGNFPIRSTMWSELS